MPSSAAVTTVLSTPTPVTVTYAIAKPLSFGTPATPVTAAEADSM